MSPLNKINYWKYYKNVPGTAIVYCKSRKQRRILQTCCMNKVNADYYHAGLNNEERSTKARKLDSK